MLINKITSGILSYFKLPLVAKNLYLSVLESIEVIRVAFHGEAPLMGVYAKTQTANSMSIQVEGSTEFGADLTKTLTVAGVDYLIPVKELIIN